MERVTLSSINQYVSATVNPADTPEDLFELYSVPSYENQYPEIVKGKEIGSAKAVVQEGDVLICKINPKINRVWVVKHNTEYPLLASSEWIVVRNSAINSNYLKWYFMSPFFRKLLTSQVAGIGGSLTRAQPKQVAKYPVPIVELEKQGKIVNLLEKVNFVISARQQQLAKLDELVKARFIEMFGKYENGTTTVFMEDVSEMITVGIANSATHAYAENGVIMFRNQNIKEGFLDDSDLIYITEEFASKYKTKQLKENDLLITRTGYPGIACIVPKKYEGTQTFTTLIVRLKNSGRVMACYACNYINSYYGKRYVESMKAGVAQQNFGAKALDKMPIFIPPMDEQIAFENFVERSYRTKLILLKGLEQMETLKKALMQQYFG